MLKLKSCNILTEKKLYTSSSAIIESNGEVWSTCIEIDYGSPSLCGVYYPNALVTGVLMRHSKEEVEMLSKEIITKSVEVFNEYRFTSKI